jgi:murein DD-endopeptidase
LKRGSVLLKHGDVVERGHVLGYIGNSGRTTYPQVYIEVKKDGRRIDPFVGLEGGRKCGVGDNPLWDEQALFDLAYRSPFIFRMKFLDLDLTREQFRRKSFRSRPFGMNNDEIHLYMDAGGIRSGDLWKLRVIGPDGSTVTEDLRSVSWNLRRYFYKFKMERQGKFWEPGKYSATLSISRHRNDEVYGPKVSGNVSYLPFTIRHSVSFEIRPPVAKPTSPSN